MARRHRDDSNRFVVSINMFNRTSPGTYLLVSVVLAVLAMYAVMIYNLWKRVVK